MSDSSESLEQGFNEDELQDIMNEIESLEQDFSGKSEEGAAKKEPETKEAAAEPEVKEEAKETKAGEVSMEELGKELGVGGEDKNDLAIKDVQKTDIQKEIEQQFEDQYQKVVDIPSKPAEPAVQEAKSTPVVNNAPAGQTGLEFSVHGDMNLQLKLHVGGQTVDVGVNANEGLVIEMANGAKFTVPLKNAG